MAKLYNRTKWPDGLLKSVLTRTARLAGARGTGVVVRVTQGRRRGWAHGNAKACGAVARWWATGRSNAKGWLATDDGRIALTLPPLHEHGAQWDVAGVAADIYRICIHEWRHVADFQAPTRLAFSSDGRIGYRRPAWADRPEEIRAMDTEADAAERYNETDARYMAEIATLLREEAPVA